MNAAPHPVKRIPDGAHVYKYGYAIITGMYSRTQREEEYTSFSDGHKSYETCHVVDYKDNSPRVSQYDRNVPNYRQYNPACSCCYLNFTHSTKKHDTEIKNA
jgi:hypothetical protein